MVTLRGDKSCVFREVDRMGIRFLWDSAVLGALSTVAISRLKINSLHTTESLGMDVLIKEIKGMILETFEPILSKCTN